MSGEIEEMVKRLRRAVENLSRPLQQPDPIDDLSESARLGNSSPPRSGDGVVLASYREEEEEDYILFLETCLDNAHEQLDHLRIHAAEAWEEVGECVNRMREWSSHHGKMTQQEARE